MKRLNLYLILLIINLLILIFTGCVSKSQEESEPPLPTPPTSPSLSWQSMNGPPGAGRPVELIQNTQGNHELYALVEQGDVYRSNDKGTSWHRLDRLQGHRVESIAVYKDKLFFSGDGVSYYEDPHAPVKINTGWCRRVIVSDSKLFTIQTKRRELKILVTDLEIGGDFQWKEIDLSSADLTALSLPPYESSLEFNLDIPNIVAIGDRILANVIVNVEGSGEMTNGCLYISKDFGDNWSEIELDVPGDVIISDIVPDPDNPEHILLVFRHPILHEATSPVSELIRESHDGGKTWHRVTELEFQSNGITSAAIQGSSYYLPNPYGGPAILKLDGPSHEIINMPTVKDFGNMVFNLDKLLFDHDDPNIVYGRTGTPWALGFLRSSDGMKIWEKMDKDIIASSPTIVVIHPTELDTVLTSGNVIQESYCTRDGGVTWEPFSMVTAGDEVRIDPYNPDHIILVDEMTNFLQSYNGGRTFSRIAQDFSSAKILDFEISRQNPDKIYASNMGVGISEYSKEWRYLTNSPDYVYDIEIDPDDSNTLYATYSPKIFESHSSIWRYSTHQEENSGWSELLRVEDSGGITSLAIDPLDSNTLYAGVIGDEGMIYVSNDRGSSWRVLNDDFVMCTVWGQSQLVIDPDDPAIAYAATWLGGTWKTNNAGQTWQLLEEAPISSTALSLNKGDTSIIYLADRSSPTVWKSDDAGLSWNMVVDFSSDGALLVMRVFADGNNIFASTFNPVLGGGKLYKSTDAGLSWQDITGTLPKGILDIAVDPSNSDIVYVTTNINGVFKSLNGGTSWMKLDGHPYVGVYDIEINPLDTSVLYTAARGGSLPAWFTQISGDFPEGIVFEDDAGIYKSTDAGLTWQKVLSTSVSCRTIRLHPDDPELLFSVDLFDGLQLSANGGESWSSLNAGLGSQVLTSCAIGGDNIYVGTQGCGVYAGDFSPASTSVIWQPDRSNKPIPTVHNLQIEVDPNNSNTIFVSAYPGGLYASTDGGITFRDRNAITPSIVVDYPLQEGYYALAINPQDSSNAWIGTWGKGIFKSYNGMILNVPAGLFGKHIRRVVVNPTNPNEVYVAAKEGVFRTEDAGLTWEEINDGLETLDIRSLKIVAGDLPPFKDDFEQGTATNWDIEEGGWSVVPDNGNYVLQGIGHKWARAGSVNWSNYTFQSRIKLEQGAVHVNFRNGEEGRYFLALHQGGLELSKQFNFWREFNDLAQSTEPYRLGRWYDLKIEVIGGNIKVYVDGVLRIDYTDPEPILQGAIAFETHDNSQVLVDDIFVELEPGDATIYAGTAGYGLYQFNSVMEEWHNLGRTLGGGYWSPWERRMYQFSSILFDPDIPGRLYYGHFPSGFFISEDSGHTWRDSSLGLGNDGMFSLAMHPDDHNVIFAGTYNGIVKSIDQGETWRMISEGMPPEQWPYTIAIDSDNTDIMYTSTKNGQNKGFCHRNEFCGVVMKSIDGGDSWFKIMTGLDERCEFYTLIIYPPDHNVLFLSTNRGVYISKNAGKQWEAINGGLPTIADSSEINNQVRDNVADNLALTSDNKYLILGLVAHGVWRLDLSMLGLD